MLDGAPMQHSRRGVGERPLAWLTAALCGALLVALAAPLLRGEVYVGDDLGAFHLPLRAFYAEQLQAGERFDWWPQLFGGMYASGEGQLGGYHPLHLALYKHLPLPVAFNLEVWLSYPVMLVGTFLWLRRRLRGTVPALFGAMLFAFSGFNLLHLFHVNAIAVVAHIPWLLLAIDILLGDASRASDGPSRRRQLAWAWLAIALLTGSQLLLGYPQYVWFSLLAEAAYAGFVGFGSRAAWAGTCTTWLGPLRLLTAKVTGLVLGGLQLLPTYDTFTTSARRSVESGFAETYSLHPLNLIQLVAPYLFETRVVGQNTHALGLYAGAVPLVLIVYLWTERNRLGRWRPLAVAVACFGLFALIMALGRFGYLYRLQMWLPVVGSFRAPCRMIVLFHLATAVLASIALARMFASRRVASDREGGATSISFRPYLLVIAASLAMLPVANLLWPQHTAALPLTLVGPVLIALAAGLVYHAVRGGRGSSWAMAGLLMLAAADLGTYGMSYSVWPHTATWQEHLANTATPSATPGRVALELPDRHGTLRHGNHVTLAGVARLHGYAGLEPQRRLDYRQSNALRAAGVAWALPQVVEQMFPPDEEDEAEVNESEAVGPSDSVGESVEEVSAPREADVAGPFVALPVPAPRFQLVSRAFQSERPAWDIRRIDVTRAALVATPLELEGGPPGMVHVVADKPGRLWLVTSCVAPRLLVTNESFHAGWRVRVDGVDYEPLRVNGDFLGAVVPGGTRRVELEFAPVSLTHGLRMSACGLGLCGIGFLLIRLGRRPRRHIDSAN